MNDQNLAILWDMDGTIIDTTECHFTTWSYTLQKYGFELDRKVYDANFGRNNRTSLPLFLGFDPDPELFKLLLKEKEARFRQVAMDEASLVQGVESWLADAKEAYFLQAVASSASMENITTLMSRFNLLQYFDVFVSGDDLPAKPEPIVFLQAAKVLDQSPENCVVIEDSLSGVKAAKKARMKCIAVTTNHPKSELALADHIVEDFTQPLADVLKDMDLL